MAAPSFNPLALIAGCAIDLGFTYAAGGAFAIAYTWLRGVGVETAGTSLDFVLPLVSLGTLGTLLGASMAARFSRRNPLAHGLGVGVVSTAMGLLFLLGGEKSAPAPWNWISLVAALPASLLGALLGSPRGR